MSDTQYIIVCPDTYEYIYPAMLFNNSQQHVAARDIRDVSTLITGSLALGPVAMSLLITSPQAADENGGPLPEPVGGVIGRWFNKRVAVLVKGKLFNKLRDQAEGEISAARLASLKPVTSEDEFNSSDFMVDSILDALQEPVIDTTDGLEDEEETAEDKEEYIPKEQEYTNISGVVRDYLVKAKLAQPDVEGFTGHPATVIPEPEPKMKPKAVKAKAAPALAEADLAAIVDEVTGP